MKNDEQRDLPQHQPECYACGSDNPSSLPLRFRESGDRVVTEVTFGPTQTGAPGFAHGGSIAAMLDDTIGTLLLARLEQAGVTAKLEIDYIRPVVLGVPLRIESWIERVEGRKVWTVAELRDSEDEVYSVAHGLFVLVGADHFLGDVGPASSGWSSGAAATPGCDGKIETPLDYCPDRLGKPRGDQTMAKAKFGIYLPQRDFAAAKQVALDAERQGFYSVSINDHFVSQIGPPDTPQTECFTTLAAIAAVTSTIRVVPAVASASYRTPAMLAKITATLDHLSGGRLVLGLGAGWQRSEYEAHGYPFPPAKERVEQLAETIQILKAMWTEDSPTFSGEYFSIAGASSYPRPVQQPHIPLMLGGSSKRMLRIAAAEADIVNLIPPTSGGKDFLKDRQAANEFTAETLVEKIASLRQLTEAAGRDPGAVEIGGLAMARITEDPDDPGLRRLIERLGVPDLDRARRSPTLLVGTPEQVIEELRHRIEEIGVTYLIIVPTSKETVDLFVKHVMPEFS